MRIPRRTNPTAGEWVVLGGTCVAAAVISKLAHLSPKWESALVYTVILFTGVVIQLRSAWHKAVLWVGLASVFVVHTIAIYFITDALPAGNEGLHGLLFVVTVLAEGGLICFLLWKIVEDRAPAAQKISRQ
jgi:peptidoglycan/LPS O-acetylase OafA/YrhL